MSGCMPYKKPESYWQLQYCMLVERDSIRRFKNSSFLKKASSGPTRTTIKLLQVKYVNMSDFLQRNSDSKWTHWCMCQWGFLVKFKA